MNPWMNYVEKESVFKLHFLLFAAFFIDKKKII